MLNYKMTGKRFHGKKPYAKKRKYKPSYNKGRGKKMPAIAGKDQNATVIETVQWPDVKMNDFNLYNFNLGQFQRAQLMSGLFRFYKASKVIWSVEPLYDTFQEGAGSCKPYIYTMMNRDQSSEIVNFSPKAPGGPQWAISALQAMGARPKQLDDKIIKYIYKPNWCSPGLLGQVNIGGQVTPVTMGLQKQYGWLATTSLVPGANNGVPNKNPLSLPSTTYTPGLQTDTVVGEYVISPNSAVSPPVNLTNSVVYNGHASYVDQAVPAFGPNSDVIVARVTCTVQWKFKGARYALAPYVPPAVDAVPPA